MTMKIKEQKELSIGSEDLKNAILSSNEPVLSSIYTMIDNERNENRHITIRPSGLIEFMDHGLSWATKQLLSINFGGNINTLIGTAVHKGAEVAYEKKINENQMPSMRQCLLQVARSCKKQYHWLNDKQKTQGIFQVYKRAKVLFETYYPLIEENNSVVSVEENIKYSNFLDENGNLLNISLAGTFDRLDNYQNELCVVDIKTGKKGLSGKTVEGFESERARILEIKESLKCLKPRKTVEVGTIPEKLNLKTKEIENQIKTLNKHSKAVRVPKDLNYSKEEFEEYKLTLPQLIECLDAQLIDLDKESELLIAAYHENRAKQYEKLSNEKSKLEDIIAIAQHENDCLKAKEEYGLQIASYAILYQLKYKRSVKYGKIERVVCTDSGTSYIKTYVFDLEDLKESLLETLSFLIDTISQWKQGVPSKVLFRHNPTTFRGSELTEIIKESNKERKLMVNY